MILKHIRNLILETSEKPSLAKDVGRGLFIGGSSAAGLLGGFAARNGGLDHAPEELFGMAGAALTGGLLGGVGGHYLKKYKNKNNPMNINENILHNIHLNPHNIVSVGTGLGIGLGIGTGQGVYAAIKDHSEGVSTRADRQKSFFGLKYKPSQINPGYLITKKYYDSKN